MRCAIATLVFVLLTAPTAAQIGLYTTEDGNSTYCNRIVWLQPTEVYILVTGEWTRARFVVPTNECFFPFDLQPLNGTTISGDFSTGFVLNFDCTTDRQAVARLSLIASFPCCGYALAPHPDAGCVELVDCEGYAVPATWMPKISSPGPTGGYCTDDGVSPPPRDPDPPDGAVEIALSVDLSWVMDPPVGSCALSFRISTVYLGTTTTPQSIVSSIEGTSHHVDGLQGGTTYYWKVKVYNYGVLVESPLWTFTTSVPVATEPSTWGRVKSLYR